MLKVLHFYKTHKPDTIGGVEQFIDHLATALPAQEVKTRVLSLSTSPQKGAVELSGYHAYQTKTLFDIASTPFSISALPAYKEHAEWADIIHFHYPYPFADLIHLLSGVRKPYVVTYHSDIVRQRALKLVYRPLEELFLRRAETIVATSPNYANSSSTLRRYQNKLEVVPLGLAPESAATEPTWPARGELNLEPNGYFLFVGVLRYYKGLHNLIASAADTGFPIIIAGDGPERERLQELAKATPNADIRFLGRLTQEEKFALLANCRAFLFPSHQRSEAFGLSLVEAAMMGKPMISCEIGTGTSFVNLDGETGIVVPPADAQSLQSAMLRLWQDPEMASAMGAAAQKRYQSHFTASAMAAAYQKIYQRVAK